MKPRAHNTARRISVHWTEPSGAPIVLLPGRTIRYSSRVIRDGTADLDFEAAGR